MTQAFLHCGRKSHVNPTTGEVAWNCRRCREFWSKKTVRFPIKYRPRWCPEREPVSGTVVYVNAHRRLP